MREIKFRQLVDDKFHYWGFGVTNGKGFTGPMNLHDPSQQFTGLQDKNGVYIYEGDIVHDTMSGGGPSEVKVDVGNFDIDWGEWPDWSWAEMAYDHMDRVEVIGNIYENKDLL